MLYFTIILSIITFISILTNYSLEKKIKQLEEDTKELKKNTNNQAIVLSTLLDWAKQLELRNGHAHVNKTNNKPLLFSYEGGDA
jgi:hypothetical protein